MEDCCDTALVAVDGRVKGSNYNTPMHVLLDKML